MPFCYETLVDSGEADYVYFGSFVRPASKDVLIVKESKLIIYTLTQTNTEVLFDDDLKLTKKLARLSENGLVEHVLEYPFFGCVLSCCTLKQLIYTQTDNNESYVSTGSKRKKLNRSALSGYIDGIVLLMDDGNLLICYFNAKEFDIKIASSYTFRGYENLVEGSESTLSSKYRASTPGTFSSANSLGNKFNISSNQEDNRVSTFKNKKESSSNQFKELPGSTKAEGQAKKEDSEDMIELAKNDPDLNYETHMAVYEHKWEINNQINNEKVYSKNYLLVFTRKQTEINFMVLQSMYSSVRGCSVTVDKEGTGGAKGPGDPGRYCNTDEGHGDGVGVDNGGNGAQNTSVSGTATSATDTGPKLLLSGQSTFDINGKFNLSNSFIKNVTFIEGYYMPIVGLLITSYPEKIGNSAYNCYSGLSKWQNLGKKGTKDSAKDESVVSCSLLVLNIDLLTLNISIINRIDNLFIDTIGVRGFCYDDFVGFVCHNNDYLLWFKLFNSSVYYQLMNVYALFHPRLAHLASRGSKVSRDKLINNMNLNVELSDYRMEVIDSTCRQWDGIEEGQEGRKEAGGMSQEQGDRVSEKDAKFVLLLPAVAGKSVYYGRLVYRSGTIVNIEWSAVSVSSASKSASAEQVCGNHFDVLPISESDLLMATTSSSNLMQMLVLSRPTSASVTNGTGVATNGVSVTNGNGVAANGVSAAIETTTAKSGTRAAAATANGTDGGVRTTGSGGARTKGGKRQKNEELSSGALAGDAKEGGSGTEENWSNVGESGMEFTVADIPVTIRFEVNNANSHVRSGVSLQCLLNVKSTGFLRSLNNFKFSPWVEVDVSSQSDMRSATVERGTGGLRSGERSGGELNYVIGIRNEKEIVEMVRKPLYYLQAVLGGEGRGDGIGLSVADSSEKSDERKLVYGKHAVTLNRKGLHIKDIGGTVTGSSSGSASVTGAADKHEEQLMLTFVHTGKVYRVYSSGVLVGGGEERVPLIGSADAKVVQCENVKNHLVLLTSDNKLHSVTVTDGSATAAKSKSEATPTKSGSRKTAKTPKARKADTEKEENEPVKVVKNVKAFNKVVGKGSYVSFLTVEDHLYLYNLETNESVFHLEGLHELNSMLRISYSSGDESVGYASNVSNTASSTDGNGNTVTSTDGNGYNNTRTVSKTATSTDNNNATTTGSNKNTTTGGNKNTSTDSNSNKNTKTKTGKGSGSAKSPARKSNKNSRDKVGKGRGTNSKRATSSSSSSRSSSPGDTPRSDTVRVNGNGDGNGGATPTNTGNSVTSATVSDFSSGSGSSSGTNGTGVAFTASVSSNKGGSTSGTSGTGVGGAASGGTTGASAGLGTSPSGNAGVGAGVGVERAQEEILMCYLTSVEDCLYLVLLISGHCIYVYQHYGRTFKLVQHKHIQPYPSLLLCESTPEDELGESTPVYKLVPRVRSHRVHSSELVTCPVVDVDKSQVVKFSREGSLDRGGEAREELKEVELTEEERDAVVEKFKARFEGFKWEIYTLKSSQKKLVIYSIQLVGVSSMLYVGEGGTGSSGDKEVKNTKDVTGEAASLCTDELYLDEGALYLLSGRDSRLYVYEMSDHFDYYYGKFSHEVYEGLKVAHHSRLNVLYSGEGATNGGIGVASNGRIGGSTNAITDGGSNGIIGGGSNGVTSGTTNAITDGGSNASGGTSGTGDNYILGDNYFVKTFSFDGGLRRVFQSVNLMSVSSRYYRYNKENNTIREATPGMSEHVAHAALRVGVMGSGTATGPKEAVGKLIALVVTVREDSLENYYNLLNTRNKLQLIHIDKEATKLDKLLVNRHLKVHIQYYQVLSSMSSSDTAYGAMGSDTVDGGVTAGGRANATVPTNNKANATVQSSGKAISGSQGSGKANPTVPSSGKANAGANGSGKANAGANGSGKADTTMVDLEEDNMIVTQDYVVLLHSSDLENILSYYKLDTFESVLSIKFGQIYERELILVGTNTNLGEYVESKGDVLILDFLHFDPLTLHHATIGGSRRGHSSRVGSGRNALDGEEALRQSRKAPLRKMALHYKKSFLYPITYVSTLESEMTVPFSPEYFTSADEDCGGVSGSGGGMKDGDGEGDGGALGPGGRENANLGQDSATARSTASNRLKDEQWLRNQFTDETNHIVHSVGSNIYIHEMKDVYSNQMIVRGAFNDLFTSISAISVFNKFLLIGDVLKGLSFFMYIYDSSNDSKNIIRIASTNPKINLPILSCSPLINRNTLTLLASDDNGNLLQFVPSNNINTDKDKLIIIGGVKFNNNIAQMLKYQDDVEYSIMAVGSCGSLYKVSMSSEDRFDFVKKFENAYESCRKNRLNIKHSCRSNLNLTKQMVNLQESIPTASQSVVSLDLLRDFYHENAEFYRNLMAKLNLNPYSLYDLFNFVYEEFY